MVEETDIINCNKNTHMMTKVCASHRRKLSDQRRMGLFHLGWGCGWKSREEFLGVLMKLNAKESLAEENIFAALTHCHRAQKGSRASRKLGC